MEEVLALLDDLRKVLFGGGERGLPDPLPAEPVSLLRSWYDEAVSAGPAKADASHNPTAMALATAAADGAPSVRTVLCKAIEPSGDLVFFTNYQGRKGRELAANPRAACVFHWDAARRQARVEGTVERTSDAENDAYFATRPLLSRLGAWASRQSEPMPDRGVLLKDMLSAAQTHGVPALKLVMPDSMTAGVHVPRPPHWGGFRLRAARIELWCGSKSGRLHDRAAWTRSAAGPAWSGEWLYP